MAELGLSLDEEFPKALMLDGRRLGCIDAGKLLTEPSRDLTGLLCSSKLP